MCSVGKVLVRAGNPGDADAFSDLVILSVPSLIPSLFGPHTRSLMKHLFEHGSNYFSFEHSIFIEAAGKVAGIALSYCHSQETKAALPSILLLLRYSIWRAPGQLYNLYKSQRIMSNTVESDYYLSNIAVYQEFRGLGLGTSCLRWWKRKLR